ETDEADLSFLAKRSHRRERIAEVPILRAEIAVVEVVEVESIGAHVPQRSLALRTHELRVVEMFRRSFDPTELRCQEDRVAWNLGKYLADQFLGLAVAIPIGGFPMRRALAERGQHRRYRPATVVDATAP